MNVDQNRKVSNWPLVYFILGGSILWFGIVFLMFDFNELSIRSNIRWSARFSLISFCIAFSASAFHKLLSNSLTQWLVDNRKYFGISFSLIHLIHLLFLFTLHRLFHKLFVAAAIVELVLGGMAYVFLVLMLLTSFDIFANLISKSNWSRLHSIGGYWILIVFSNGIFGRIASGQTEYFSFGIVLVTVWGVRLLVWKKRFSSNKNL